LRHHAAVAEFAAFEQVLVKVSGVVEVSREPFPFRDVHELLAEALERFGADRLMWGSNYPVVLETCDYASSLTYLEASGVFADGELDEVLAGACARLLDETPVVA
jgi:predicted TIM-barrel fold metal-dependent hydrolase